MSVALFIVPEGPVPGLDPHVSGKALGRSRSLDVLYRRAGVRPLTDFFSEDPEEAAAFAADEGLDPPPGGFPPERWFAAADGLATVRGLLAHLAAHPRATPDADDLAGDLQEFETVLTGLATPGIRWHLAVDY